MSVSCDGSANGWAAASTDKTQWNFAGDFTVACWVKTSATATAAIWDFRDSSKNMGMTYSDSTSKRPEYSSNANFGSIDIIGGTDINDGSWHSLIVERSGSTVTFYVDNSSQGTGTTSANFDGTNSLYLADQGAGGGIPWTGNIAKYVVYKSLAWSSGDRSSYQSSGGTTIPSSPSVEYIFASSLALLTDSSGNGNTLIPQGTGLGFTYSTDEPSGPVSANGNFLSFM